MDGHRLVCEETIHLWLVITTFTKEPCYWYMLLIRAVCFTMPVLGIENETLQLYYDLRYPKVDLILAILLLPAGQWCWI